MADNTVSSDPIPDNYTSLDQQQYQAPIPQNMCTSLVVSSKQDDEMKAENYPMNKTLPAVLTNKQIEFSNQQMYSASIQDNDNSIDPSEPLSYSTQSLKSSSQFNDSSSLTSSIFSQTFSSQYGFSIVSYSSQSQSSSSDSSSLSDTSASSGSSFSSMLPPSNSSIYSSNYHYKQNSTSSTSDAQHEQTDSDENKSDISDDISSSSQSPQNSNSQSPQNSNSQSPQNSNSYSSQNSNSQSQQSYDKQQGEQMSLNNSITSDIVDNKSQQIQNNDLSEKTESSIISNQETPQNYNSINTDNQQLSKSQPTNPCFIEPNKHEENKSKSDQLAQQQLKQQLQQEQINQEQIQKQVEEISASKPQLNIYAQPFNQNNKSLNSSTFILSHQDESPHISGQCPQPQQFQGPILSIEQNLKIKPVLKQNGFLNDLYIQTPSYYSNSPINQVHLLPNPFQQQRNKFPFTLVSVNQHLPHAPKCKVIQDHLKPLQQFLEQYQYHTHVNSEISTAPFQSNSQLQNLLNIIIRDEQRKNMKIDQQIEINIGDDNEIEMLREQNQLEQYQILQQQQLKDIVFPLLKQTQNLLQLYDIFELAKSQDGCRLLQIFVALSDTNARQQLFERLFPYSEDLASDEFGNFVIQEFFRKQFDIKEFEQFNNIIQFMRQVLKIKPMDIKDQDNKKQYKQKDTSETKNNDKEYLKTLFDRYNSEKLIKKEEHVENAIKFANRIKGNFISLSQDQFGCRVIQLLISVLPRADCIQITEELKPAIFSLLPLEFKSVNRPLVLKNKHNSYVIQRLLMLLPPRDLSFILEVVQQPNIIDQLLKSQEGCCILQHIVNLNIFDQCMNQFSLNENKEELNACHIFINIEELQDGKQLAKSSNTPIPPSIETQIPFHNQYSKQFDQINQYQSQYQIQQKQQQQRKKNNDWHQMREQLIDYIIMRSPIIIQDKAGNYVLQRIIETESFLTKYGQTKPNNIVQRILECIQGQLAFLSLVKESSNVIEKCVRCGEDSDRQFIFHELMNTEIELRGQKRYQFGQRTNSKINNNNYNKQSYKCNQRPFKEYDIYVLKRGLQSDLSRKQSNDKSCNEEEDNIYNLNENQLNTTIQLITSNFGCFMMNRLMKADTQGLPNEYNNEKERNENYEKINQQQSSQQQSEKLDCGIICETIVHVIMQNYTQLQSDPCWSHVLDTFRIIYTGIHNESMRNKIEEFLIQQERKSSCSSNAIQYSYDDNHPVKLRPITSLFPPGPILDTPKQTQQYPIQINQPPS